jgi:hypothetical protein
MIGNTMSARRRHGKRTLERLLVALAALAWFGGAIVLAPIAAATTELVVVDRNTGLAIGGFDPVAYFTNGTPTLGDGDHEFGYAGAIWRFHNAGNRWAFMTDVDLYAPRFGGYDVVGLARGVAVAGNPLVWLIAGDRLYLFYSDAARQAFSEDPITILAAATRNWKTIQSTLSP